MSCWGDTRGERGGDQAGDVLRMLPPSPMGVSDESMSAHSTRHSSGSRLLRPCLFRAFLGSNTTVR